MAEYAFLIYSSSKSFHGVHSYEYGFANHTFSIVGDKPFSRGDIVNIIDYKKESRNEFRINVKVLGDPKINTPSRKNLYMMDRNELGNLFDIEIEAVEDQVEVPTLLFLSSRIYLSEFSDYEVVDTTNARVLSFEGVQQDRNKIYAVAALVTSAEARILAKERSTGVRFEWSITDKDQPRRRGVW